MLVIVAFLLAVDMALYRPYNMVVITGIMELCKPVDWGNKK